MDTTSTQTDKCTDADQSVLSGEEEQTLTRVEFADGSTDLFISFQIDPSGNWVKLEMETENLTVPRERINSIVEAW